MMVDFSDLLDDYSSEYYLTYSRLIPQESWGNRQVASIYLEKYFLPHNEYVKKWKPIQERIFKNERIGLPEIVFADSYELLAINGGVIFEKADFEKMQRCAKAVGDQNIVIIQNDFGNQVQEPLFKMKYPVDISWDELMSGNFISSVLFEMFHNEYFVFSESAAWGMYCANDYESPLNIIGFKPAYSELFMTEFKQQEEEIEELKEWLPEQYRPLVKW